MTLPIATANNQRIGTCPHGLPMGACPICNGMGGGAQKKDFSAKPGEMSWAECAAIGRMIRAQMNAKTQANNHIQAQIMIANFQRNMVNLATALASFNASIQRSIPAALAKPIILVVSKILIPTINILKDIPTNIQKFAQEITQKFIDISDKLSAIYGEMKNAIEKKISESFKNIKKKTFSILNLFTPVENSKLDKQIKENSKTFEIKEFFQKIYSKISERKEK